MAMKLKDAFAAHLRSTNVEGSGKAKSYLRALDLLSEMLRSVPLGFEDCRGRQKRVSPMFHDFLLLF